MRKLIHGGDVYRNPDCIDFSANINPLGPPDSVKKAVAACVNDIAHYPDVQCKELKRRLGWAEQMEEEALIIGNGAAELIFALGYSLRPKRALLPQPTFAEYEQALLAAGCEVFYYPLSEENGFRLTEDFLQVLTGEIDMVFLCNPNNPTGVLTERDLLIQILNRCKEKQIFLVVDECFLDFVEEAEAFELKEMTRLYSNLFLLKAFNSGAPAWVWNLPKQGTARKNGTGSAAVECLSSSSGGRNCGIGRGCVCKKSKSVDSGGEGISQKRTYPAWDEMLRI